MEPTFFKDTVRNSKCKITSFQNSTIMRAQHESPHPRVHLTCSSLLCESVLDPFHSSGSTHTSSIFWQILVDKYLLNVALTSEMIHNTDSWV